MPYKDKIKQIEYNRKYYRENRDRLINEGIIVPKYKKFNWIEISKDTRSYKEIAIDLGINEKTIRRNLKKLGLKHEKIITNNSRVEHYCKKCNKNISRGNKSQLCHSCIPGHPNKNKGIKVPPEKSMRWKGGRIKVSGGYISIHSPNHPYRNINKYVPEHRLVVEEFIKRYLKPEERIHHINMNKQDNRIENLMLFPNDREHAKFHQKIRQFKLTNPIKRQIENRWDELKKQDNLIIISNEFRNCQGK